MWIVDREQCDDIRRGSLDEGSIGDMSRLDGFVDRKRPTREGCAIITVIKNPTTDLHPTHKEDDSVQGL